MTFHEEVSVPTRPVTWREIPHELLGKVAAEVERQMPDEEAGIKGHAIKRVVIKITRDGGDVGELVREYATFWGTARTLGIDGVRMISVAY